MRTFLGTSRAESLQGLAADDGAAYHRSGHDSGRDHGTIHRHGGSEAAEIGPKLKRPRATWKVSLAELPGAGLANPLRVVSAGMIQALVQPGEGNVQASVGGVFANVLDVLVLPPGTFGCRDL